MISSSRLTFQEQKVSKRPKYSYGGYLPCIIIQVPSDSFRSQLAGNKKTYSKINNYSQQVPAQRTSFFLVFLSACKKTMDFQKGKSESSYTMDYLDIFRLIELFFYRSILSMLMNKLSHHMNMFFIVI